MFVKKIKLVLIFILLYQNPLHSKSTSFNDFNSKTLSKYFSGIIAFENKDSSKSLDFFKTSKVLLNNHEPYLKRYVYSLVLENRINEAISVIKQKGNKNKPKFFESYLLLAIDSLKRNNFTKAYDNLTQTKELIKKDRFNSAILDSLIDYILVFKEKRLPEETKNLGNLSTISSAFQRCYLQDENTESFFLNLINNNDSDFTRYIFFYLVFLIDYFQINDAIYIIV